MIDENVIVRDRQRLIRSEMTARGILVKQVQHAGGWDSPSTVTSYFPADEQKEPATMSVAALYRMIAKRALPVEVLSLLLPEGFVIARVPEGMDLDDFEAGCRDFLATKGAAHHPDSPAGRELSACENEKLSEKVVRLRAVA